VDPNNWPAFMWVVLALGFGSIVTSLLLFLWKAIFGRRAGWLVDSVLLGSSGFVLVLAMMAYMLLIADRVPEQWQKLVGYSVLGGIGLPLAWASVRIRKWKIDSRKNRMVGPAKGEITIPSNLNSPLRNEGEDEFCK
jgi:hypothetical protein